MHLGIWNDINARIDERPDLSSVPYQAYVTLTCGATRIEEKKVFNIESFR
jgi:hypothetical protein